MALFPATIDTTISLTSLHATDLGTLKAHNVCSECGEPVKANETVDSVAVGDSHIVLNATDLASLAPASRKVVDVKEFVGLHQIALVHYEKPYVVRPASPDYEPAFDLLIQALRRTGQAGIGKISFRTRERLAAIALENDDLMLFTLRFCSEIREMAPLESDLADASTLSLLSALIAEMSTSDDYWTPAHYVDVYLSDLSKLIAKLKGKPRTPTVRSLKTSIRSAERHAVRI